MSTLCCPLQYAHAPRRAPLTCCERSVHRLLLSACPNPYQISLQLPAVLVNSTNRGPTPLLHWALPRLVPKTLALANPLVVALSQLPDPWLSGGGGLLSQPQG